MPDDQEFTVNGSEQKSETASETDEEKELAEAERSFLASQTPGYRPAQISRGTRHQNSGLKNGNEQGQGWKKGQTGNPGGRPKTALVSKALREILGELVPNDPAGRTYAQLLARIMVERAVFGDEKIACDITAAREVLDRAEGKAQQYIEIQQTVLQAAYSHMNYAELEAYAKDGSLPEWWPKGTSEAIQ